MWSCGKHENRGTAGLSHGDWAPLASCSRGSVLAPIFWRQSSCVPYLVVRVWTSIGGEDVRAQKRQPQGARTFR
ncbi:hypothetical protein V5799_033782 [Amblyomma americanum]|uniref:Uncharacterized protein n=1 Tax=Amblyomma americanum TaxID=6943 RepID=A0AAQ4DMB5_AMBAM